MKNLDARSGKSCPADRPDRSALHLLCGHHGITTEYLDEEGAPRPVPEESLRLVLASLGAGLDLAGEPAPSRPTLPEGVSCHCPDWLRQSRAWGLTCQLYELRSARNWGIGDLRDLRDLARVAGAAGADFLGVNPLHALFLADPARCSPFSPSDRRFLNPLYIAVDEVPGAPQPAGEILRTLRAGEIVDYPAVARLKIEALRAAFDAAPLEGRDRAEHDAFREAGGAPLWRHALFETVSMAMVAEGHGAGWQTWPEAMRDWQDPAVASFAAGHERDIAFQIWLQWVAHGQLAQVREAASEAGMRIGLYLDLAVGEAPDGSSTWSDPGLALPALGLGAPPDVFATEGQTWNLVAPSPRVLAARGFEPFRAMVGSQMAQAGALRIDHAMALWQLFLVPEGESPRLGTHLRYPFADMVRVLAEESQRRRSIVIGEDLGFVPEGLREAMAAAAILSYRILYFERHDGAFRPPEAYPALALACLSTHDLPTLAAWWRSDDVMLRKAHGLVDDASSAEHLAARETEREALIACLSQEGLLATDASPAAPDLSSEILVAAHRFIARTPSLLAAVRLADLIGPVAPTNLPGTAEAYPNWRLRCPVPIEELTGHPAFLAVTDAMARERPRHPGAAFERPGAAGDMRKSRV